MTEGIDLSGDAGSPDPTRAATAAEFVEAMRSLKRWTGWGYRRLEKRATAAGHALPRSTLTVALARDTLPREDLVAAFARACGCDEDQTARWIAARRRIAAAGPVGPVPDTAPAEPRPGVRVLLIGPTTPSIRRARWPVRAVVALVLFATAVAVAQYVLTPGSRSAAGPSPDRAAPALPDSSQFQAAPPAPATGTGGTPTTTPTTTPPASGTTLTSRVPDIPPVTAPPTGPATPVIPPLPGTPPPSTNPTEPPPAIQPGRETIQLAGQAPINCPMPYVGTMYGPLAQCVQESDNQARPGLYSPFTGEFGPSTDWMPVAEKKWFDAPVLATDEIRAWARGYATVETKDGPEVWATQYRNGEARWGVINLSTNRFEPSLGWQPAG